jgi:hypothetical protein
MNGYETQRAGAAKLRNGQSKKSSHSEAHGNCVLVRLVATIEAAEVEVRDSKDPEGPVLSFTLQEWRAFTDGVKAGEFDVS